MADGSDSDFSAPRAERRLYWMMHRKVEFLLIGVLPGIAWCLFVYLVIGHSADARNLHGDARIRFYHAQDFSFFPGLSWLAWRLTKLF